MKYIEVSTVSFETASMIVRIGIDEARKIGVSISVAVVDPGMNLVAFGKDDGATAHSVETSRRKANTAASTRRESGWMDASIELQLPLGANNMLTNIPGGHPVIFDDKIVGGFGVAGGTVEQDAAIAEAIKRVINEQSSSA